MTLNSLINLLIALGLLFNLISPLVARNSSAKYLLPTTYTRFNAKNRIIGGKNVDIILHPHHVSIRRRLNRKLMTAREHICSGSIVSPTIVVTAAHCVSGRRSSEFHIVAGTNLREGSDGITIPVRDYVMHEKYSASRDQNDIALLFLAIPLAINNFTIKSIELDKETARVGAIGIVTGWGETGRGFADVLQEAVVPIISNELCNKDYNPRAYIADGQMCAGTRGAANKDACKGDSGAPLVVYGKLAGIVSWGFGCGNPEYSGVYTRISYYHSWLIKKVKEYYS